MKRFAFSAFAAAALLGVGALHADSQYGYSSTGATGVQASAGVQVQVTVPTLILLRVGNPQTPLNLLTLTATPTVTSAPATPADGSLQAANWDGNAPVFGTAPSATVRAFAWTNSPGGAQLGLASVVDTPLGGITPADITVSAAAVGALALLTHPATTATNANYALLPRNTVHQADWTYSIGTATLNAAAAGTYLQTTTYTATAL